MNVKKWMLLVLIGVAVITGCEKEEEIEKDEAPELTQRINGFIEDVMTDVYLWYKEMPAIDIRYEFDSQEYFNKLLYIEDKWSFVTDDIVAFENSLQGIEKSFGYSLAFGRFLSTGNIYAVVEFVYPNTPASQAGIKRGDFIIEISGANITDNNYRDLLNAENLNITLGVLSGTTIYRGSTVSMTSRELNLDPVLIKKVIEHEGHRIGYLFYAQYIANYNSSLDDAFRHFRDEQVTDLVIDLRYNPGGYTSAAQHLCSSFAPLNEVNTSGTLVTFQWNDKYQNYWERNNRNDQLKVTFLNSVPVKLGLNKVHILTGSGTASASELSITGLKPYMSVTMVGDTTYGKYTASITLKPEDFYEDENYYSGFKNWGIQPIVIRYANSQGVTDFKNGFVPDILAEDEPWSAIPLGSINETLLRTAIEDITGSSITAVKSTQLKIPFEMFDRGFSEFDRNKRELIYDGISRKEFRQPEFND